MIDTTILARFFDLVFMPLVPIVAAAVITLTLFSVFIVLFTLFFPKEL